jgi:Tol biopolymer transport system component/DNA-binding winged helix-turn-helix (wHTH) protein
MASGVPATKPDSARRVVRFAGFEFDLETGELRKHGLRIRLQGQPIDVLGALIEHPGEVVTREELQRRLWPADTYVDFEHSLNAAIKRLRAALGDSADAPRYIETLPRQGYRFIAPLIYPAAEAAISEPGVSPMPGIPPVVRKRKPGVWTRAALAAAAIMALAAAAGFWLHTSEKLWRDPIAGARFQTVTDSDGVAQDAAVSRDGHLVAFLSDRDGPMDVWVTQVGSGIFHNLTRGSASSLVNDSLRTLGFSPDGSLVTYWDRRPNGPDGSAIGVWAVPTLGGQPKPYLDGIAEFDWTRDGARLAYHTPGPGDPLFVSDGVRPQTKPILTAPAGMHSHFQVWSPDAKFIYFVQGSLPDKLDIWRIAPSGGTPQRITFHNSRVSHPIFLDRRTLLYLATDPDGSGPWLYGMDVERRVPHRLTSGLDRYTSLAASADGRRLAVTVPSTKRTLWRAPMGDSPAAVPAEARILLTTSAGSSPRLGPDYLLYVSTTSAGASIWKHANGTDTELWKGPGAQIFGGPSISSDGQAIAFSVRLRGRTLLYTMRSDGTQARTVSDSLDLQGSPAWAPDGRSIATAANERGSPRLFRIPGDGGAPVPFVQDYSLDPVWTPDGRMVVYSGPDIGTEFSVKAVTAQGVLQSIPKLTLTRGARHLSVLPGGRSLVFLRGNLQHKNLWLMDLETGAQRQLTNLAPNFDVRDFDISADGREMVLERVQGRSDVVLLDLPGK